VKRGFVMLVVASLAALLTAGLAGGAFRSETYKLSAKLTAGQEVPKPKGAGGATGTFVGTLVGRKLTWKVTYRGLTGKAMQAHIHLGRPGKSGNVLVPLCPPRCRSGMHGTKTVSSSIRDAIERGRTYVNVHTAKNPAGEIRGQVKSTES
jgi:CHRD domain